jgi:aromatic ring hydroxylase
VEAWEVTYLIEQTVASGLICLNSSARDVKNPESRPYLDKLMKLLWDPMGTEFAGRHELYEIYYGGSTEKISPRSWPSCVPRGMCAYSTRESKRSTEPMSKIARQGGPNYPSWGARDG